jgi:hypothetical protein
MKSRLSAYGLRSFIYTAVLAIAGLSVPPAMAKLEPRGGSTERRDPQGTVEFVEVEPNDTAATANDLGTLDDSSYLILAGIKLSDGLNTIDCGDLHGGFPAGVLTTFDPDNFAFSIPIARRVRLSRNVIVGETFRVFDNDGVVVADFPPGNVTAFLDLPAGRYTIEVGLGTGGNSLHCYIISVTPSPFPAVAELSFDPPAGQTLDPPQNLSANIISVGGSHGLERTAVQPPPGVVGYNVYRSTSPHPQATPANLLATLPPTQTTLQTDLPSSGAFFVVTADYGDDGESAPSNEAGAGQPGADVASVTVKGSKINATGTGFTDTVLVFVDGIPLSTRAKVKKQNTLVKQGGRLLTGESIAEYFTTGKAVELVFLNNDGGLTRKVYTKP